MLSYRYTIALQEAEKFLHPLKDYSGTFYHLGQGAQGVNAPLPPLEGVAAPMSYLAGVFRTCRTSQMECGEVFGHPLWRVGCWAPPFESGGVWAPLFLTLASLQLQRKKISEQEEMIEMWSNGIRGNVHRYQLINATLIIELNVVYHLISCFLFFSWNWLVLV